MTGIKGRRLFTKMIAAGAVTLAMLPMRGVAENLADALASAYNTSGLLQQNRALLRAADEDLAGSVAGLRPVIDFVLSARQNYNASGNDFTARSSSDSANMTAQISLDLLLFDNGATRIGIDAQKETVLATRQQLLSVEQSILLRAVNAYFNVLLQGENVAIQRNNLTLLQEELRAAQDRFDVGEVTRTDVALAESRVAGARSDLASTQGNLANARSEYIAATGRTPGQLTNSDRLPSAPATVDIAVAKAVATHPDLLAAQHQVRAADLSVLSNTKSLGPSVSLSSQVSATEALSSSDYSEDASITLSMRQRLYQGGGQAAQLRRTKASRDSTRANLLTVQRNVVQNVNNAFVRLQVAQASIAASNERVRAAQVAFDGVREEATLGARTTLDVLSSEQELLNARIALISARSERALAAYELLSTQGLLTAQQLGLDVQIYDAEAYYNLAKGAPARLSRRARQLDRVIEALGK